MAAVGAPCLSGASAEPREHHSSKYHGLASLDAAELAKAEERYGQVLSGGTDLHLRGLRLVSLPDDLGDCAALEYLDCSGNGLTTLPKTIGKCSSLTQLNCGDNNLIEFPESLSNCAALKNLTCRVNSLSSLPKNIGNCKSLVSLWCDRNNLAALPETLGHCPMLKRLWCESNKLTTLPENIVNCASLKHFDCGNNDWDPAWLKAQGLSPGDSPTLDSLQVLSARQSAGRIKPARGY